MLLPKEIKPKRESWYHRHHMVQHDGQDRLVFKCSFRYQGMDLNGAILPGPPLSPSLLGVLHRFREHAVGISGDIWRMFHQVHLLLEGKPLLWFV